MDHLIVRILLAALVMGGILGGRFLSPLRKFNQFQFAPSKVISLSIAIGGCVILGSPIFLLIASFPLSLIWYPEHWGRYQGWIGRGPPIDQESPPAAIAALGWFFLIVFPLIVYWAGWGAWPPR